MFSPARFALTLAALGTLLVAACGPLQPAAQP